MPSFGKRRALGQHFLRDAQVARAIATATVDAVVEKNCVALLEIGPGKGAITDPILDELHSRAPGVPMLLCERDPALAEEWKAKARAHPGLDVRAGDFLELPDPEWLARAPLAVASNLPYSSGTAILNRLASHPERIAAMVLMFQAEVAQRLRAAPGTKAWGSLSIWIQNRWDVRKLRSVGASSFSPPPDVESEVVTLTPRVEPRIAIPDSERADELWQSLLKAAFAHRRKMLRSSLPDPYRNALERAELDGTKRAEALSWDEWSRFYGALIISVAGSARLDPGSAQ